MGRAHTEKRILQKIFGFAVKKLSTKFSYSQNEINFDFVTVIVKALSPNRRQDPGGLMSRTGKPHSGPACPKWTHCPWSVLNVRARAALWPQLLLPKVDVNVMVGAAPHLVTSGSTNNLALPNLDLTNAWS